MKEVDQAMNSEDEATVRAVVRQFKSRLFNPMIRPFYKYTIICLLVLIFACFVYWVRVVNSQLFATVLLCIPLGYSFGFFLKPITSYHIQSTNFTYYFGVLTSFLLASGFSEWRYFMQFFLSTLPLIVILLQNHCVFVVE
jgi:hypothetical protein